MFNNVTAKWSGSYPCLCYGEWALEINGKDYTDFIPKEKRTSSMNTFGVYESWHFTDDWDEEWEDYEDGLYFKEWIKENEWVNEITKDEEEQLEIYYAFSENDFRQDSCGGCI